MLAWMPGVSTRSGRSFPLWLSPLLTYVWFSAAELKAAEVEKRGALEDDDVIRVLASMVKKRRQAAEEFRKGNREDLAAQEEVA